MLQWSNSAEWLQIRCVSTEKAELKSKAKNIKFNNKTQIKKRNDTFFQKNAKLLGEEAAKAQIRYAVISLHTIMQEIAMFIAVK